MNKSNTFSIRALAVFVVFMCVFSGVSIVSADEFDTGWYDSEEYYTPDTGWYDSYDYYTPDTGWYDTYDSYTPDTGWYDTSDYYTPDTGWYDSYDYYTPSYDYGCGSYCGGGQSYDWGCGSYCGGGNYTTPGCSFCGGTSYSPPRYSPPVITQPVHSSSSYFSNTNTNTNVNNVTNIDNSIRDSFNTYDSYNTSLVVAQPQTPIVYTPPVQPAPYCVINNAQANGYGSAYIAWSSTNGTSAYISNIGSVAVSGSQTVYAAGNTSYTMTVYGYNGQSATCSTYVAGYVAPAPYVSLTQIPYTGFDFGPVGNAMYWVSLLAFAAAGAYLMIYYRGGALAFATAMAPVRKQKFAPVVAPKAPILIEKEAALAAAEIKVQPVVAALRKVAGTIDTMAIVASKDGSMPKIVIQRA